jgi:hypothetical protein
MEKEFLSIDTPAMNSCSDTDEAKPVMTDHVPNLRSDTIIETAGASEGEFEYVVGFKLIIVMISVTSVGFLIMLDTSIISTVSFFQMPTSRFPKHKEKTLGVMLHHHSLIMDKKAIPRITSDFHSLPDVGWYGSAYLLAKFVGFTWALELELH